MTIKTKGILNITVRRLSDIERAIRFTMSRIPEFRAGSQPAEIHIDVKPNAKRATRLR